MPWQQLYANILWLSSIQYIGANVDHLDHKGIYTLLDSLTTLSPFWVYTYTFGQLVIPMQKTPLQRGSVTGDTLEAQKESRNDAIKLGLK